MCIFLCLLETFAIESQVVTYEIHRSNLHLTAKSIIYCCLQKNLGINSPLEVHTHAALCFFIFARELLEPGDVKMDRTTRETQKERQWWGGEILGDPSEKAEYQTVPDE